jgi:hypothetical protein
MEDQVLIILSEFFQTEFKIDPAKINRNTSLLYDLNIFGDDVDDVLKRLIKTFNIEVKTVDLSRFFIGDEPFDFLSPLGRFLKNKPASKMTTLTMADLESFVKTGILK